MKKLYKPVVCENGFRMSVQADEMKYCEPRNNTGPYTQVEVGYPSQKESLLMEYAENPDDPTETVYGWVPSNIIWDVILKHGGVAQGELPPLSMT